MPAMKIMRLNHGLASRIVRMRKLQQSLGEVDDHGESG
jgi:hypothetical protein